MTSRTKRLIVVPAIVFLLVSGTVFTLALLHPARADEPSVKVVELGDPVRGAAVFAETCAGCHGQGGRNGTVGPDLAGKPIPLSDAQTQIENGGGPMPPNLVTGRALEDVLAYLREDVLAR